MNQTNTNRSALITVQALAYAKLDAADILLRRVIDPRANPKDVRRLGCAILRVPYLRVPRHKPTPKPHTTAKPAPKTPAATPIDPAFIAFVHDFNTRLAKAKLAVQQVFLKLIQNPATPPEEHDRLALAVLRCALMPPTPAPPAPQLRLTSETPSQVRNNAEESPAVNKPQNTGTTTSLNLATATTSSPSAPISHPA